jgi:hypothetical protein
MQYLTAASIFAAAAYAAPIVPDAVAGVPLERLPSAIAGVPLQQLPSPVAGIPLQRLPSAVVGEPLIQTPLPISAGVANSLPIVPKDVAGVPLEQVPSAVTGEPLVQDAEAAVGEPLQRVKGAVVGEPLVQSAVSVVGGVADGVAGKVLPRGVAGAPLEQIPTAIAGVPLVFTPSAIAGIPLTFTPSAAPTPTPSVMVGVALSFTAAPSSTGLPCPNPAHCGTPTDPNSYEVLDIENYEIAVVNGSLAYASFDIFPLNQTEPISCTTANIQDTFTNVTIDCGEKHDSSYKFRVTVDEDATDASVDKWGINFIHQASSL